MIAANCGIRFRVRRRRRSASLSRPSTALAELCAAYLPVGNAMLRPFAMLAFMRAILWAQGAAAIQTGDMAAGNDENVAWQVIFALSAIELVKCT